MGAFNVSGTPITGVCSLTNGAPGPTNFTLQQVSNGSTYTLGAKEVVVITSISISSNDTAQPTITIDDGITGAPFTARVLAKVYTGASLPAATMAFPPGMCVCRRAVLPRATASAVTTAKTVEIVIVGYVTQGT